MLRVLDNNLKLLAVFDKVLICKTRTVLNAEYLLNFTVTVDNNKSQHLYTKTNILVIDDDYFKVYKLKEVHKTGQAITLDIQAEHIDYKLIDTTINNFDMTGTILEIGTEILRGTGFNFETDFTEIVHVKVDGEATRKALLLALVNKCAGEIEYWKFNIRMMRDIGKNKLFATFGNNINEVTREIDFFNNTSNYTVKLIDTTNRNLKELKKAHLGDVVVVTDTELGIHSVEKKVIEVEKDHILGVHTKVTLGDPLPKVIEAIQKNIKVGNVITEVIHQQVINVETAHILNAWIKNLFVEYLETNMDARLDRTTIERHFIRIEDVKEEMVQQMLSTTEVEDFLINDPKGTGGKINVYFTAIGNHVDAYRYFTITNPKLTHKDLTDAEVEAFKVKVKKVVSESIMYSKNFQVVKMADGSETYGVIELIGQGTDTTGETNRGKGFRYKEQRGQVIGTYNENNDGITAILFDGVDCVPKYYDMNKKDFVPLVNNWIGGDGNVVLHKDKTVLTQSDMVNRNALHVGYNSTGSNIIGKASTLFLDGITLLGVELSNMLPPVDSMYDELLFNHFTSLNEIAYPSWAIPSIKDLTWLHYEDGRNVSYVRFDLTSTQCNKLDFKFEFLARLWTSPHNQTNVISSISIQMLESSYNQATYFTIRTSSYNPSQVEVSISIPGVSPVYTYLHIDNQDACLDVECIFECVKGQPKATVKIKDIIYDVNAPIPSTFEYSDYNIVNVYLGSNRENTIQSIDYFKLEQKQI